MGTEKEHSAQNTHRSMVYLHSQNNEKLNNTCVNRYEKSVREEETEKAVSPAPAPFVELKSSVKERETSYVK